MQPFEWKMAKRRRFAPEKPGNHTKEGKGKLERGRRKKGREQKKAMVALLVFILAILEMFLNSKMCLSETSVWR